MRLPFIEILNFILNNMNIIKQNWTTNYEPVLNFNLILHIYIFLVNTWYLVTIL